MKFEDLFGMNKRLMFLIEMNKNKGRRYSLDVSKSIGVSSSNGMKMANKLIEMGLIKKHEKQGRIAYLEVTKKGIEVSRMLGEIKFIIENDKRS